MRTLLAYASLVVMTLACGLAALAGQLLGLRGGPGSLNERLLATWARGILFASGVRVVVHGDAHLRGTRQVFIANHVSRYDVLALAAVLRNVRFVAKAELARIPLFGRAARAVGTVYIHRQSRQASFDAYATAMAEIGEGASVVVFAEGTRGTEYALRPFKKGPFVLAIASGAPVVPTVVHGAMEVHALGERAVHAGEIHVTFLEPIAVQGLTYADRDALAVTVRDRMAEVLEDTHGVASPPWDPRGESTRGSRSPEVTA